MIFRHSAWAAAAAIILAVSRFALVAVIAHLLPHGAFGQYAYGQWMVDLAFLVCSFGMTSAASRYIAEAQGDPGMLAAFMRYWRPLALGLPWLAGLAVIAGIWISGLVLATFDLTMLALWAIASGVWAMQTAALIGMQRFDLVFLANLIGAVIMLGGVLWMPLSGGTPGPVFALMAVACTCAASVGLSRTLGLAGVIPAIIRPARWRAMHIYAVNMWLTALLWSLVWSRGELPVVRAYLGDIGVAHYAVALALFGGAIQGVMLGISGVAQQMTRLWGEGCIQEAVKMARYAMDVQILLCGVAALVLICVGPELIELIFGEAYRDAAGPLVLFGFGLLAMAASCQNHMLQLATDARYNRDITLLGLIVLFGTALLLTPRYGLDGAAFARGGTLFVLASVSVVVTVRRWGKASVSIRNILATTFITVTAGACVLSGAVVSIIPRFGMLIVASTLLALAISDRHGRLLSLSLPMMLLSRIENATIVQRIRGLGL